jgi:processive 1,2-diacylglycerol beta-glucosyltransferase
MRQGAMNESRRILVLTLSFGSGHVRAAKAVACEMRAQAPGSEVVVLDALKDCRRLFRAFYEWPYWLMLRYAPMLWDRFSAARITHQHQSTAPAWAFRLGCPKVFSTIKSFTPDVIVAVEVAACEMAVIARRLGLTRAPILSVITDYESEPVWVKPEVAAFTVADEHVRAELIGWGAPPSQIAICGIPVDPAFDTIHDPKTIRRRLLINEDAPLVLLMGGGMGPTRMHEVARRLAESKMPMQIVAVAGKDERARRKLERVSVAPPVSMRILGWTDEVPALMQAAAVLVTKPGGLTTAEASLCSLPQVFFDPIPGAEFVNAKRMVDAGAAVMTQGAKETTDAVLLLLQDERLRQVMALRAGGMERPAARKEIAQLALGLAARREEILLQQQPAVFREAS